MTVLAALGPLRAGGIFCNSNQSAEYLRTFERNGSQDNGDAAYYNMAGTPALPGGLTLNVSNQSAFQRATVATRGNPALGDREYRSTNPAWVVPNAHAVLRRGDHAWFAGIQTIAASAVREWRQGLPSLDLLGLRQAGFGGAASAVMAGDAYGDALQAGRSPGEAQGEALRAGLDAAPFRAESSLKGSSCFLAWRLGGALRVNSWLSVAAAGRLVHARQEVVGRVEGVCAYDHDGHDLRTRRLLLLHKREEATGFSVEAGLDLRPRADLLVNLTFEAATPLVFRTRVLEGKDGGGLFRDGERTRLDLPAVLRLGVGFQASPVLRASFGLNAYLERDARMDLGPGSEDSSGDYGNTVEAGASLERRLSRAWLVSAGVNYNWIGQRPQGAADLSPAGGHRDYASLGAGFQWEPGERVKVNLGLAHTRFVRPLERGDRFGDRLLWEAFLAQGVEIHPRKVYDKRYFILAVGLDYRFSW
jgi:long-chain fatty acid transport protein